MDIREDERCLALPRQQLLAGFGPVAVGRAKVAWSAFGRRPPGTDGSSRGGTVPWCAWLACERDM